MYTQQQADEDRLIQLHNEQALLKNKEINARNKNRGKNEEQELLTLYHDYNDPAKTENWIIRLKNEKTQETNKAIILDNHETEQRYLNSVEETRRRNAEYPNSEQEEEEEQEEEQELEELTPYVPELNVGDAGEYFRTNHLIFKI